MRKSAIGRPEDIVENEVETCKVSLPKNVDGKLVQNGNEGCPALRQRRNSREQRQQSQQQPTQQVTHRTRPSLQRDMPFSSNTSFRNMPSHLLQRQSSQSFRDLLRTNFRRQSSQSFRSLKRQSSLLFESINTSLPTTPTGWAILCTSLA